MKLYTYWRSAAGFRVRAALHLKGLAYEEEVIDLDQGDQLTAAYASVNPFRSVPALVTDDGTLVESLAILEWLEERHPAPPLLPPDPAGRARVRALAQLVACDIHPLYVPRVRAYLSGTSGLDAAGWRAWQTHWFTAGMQAMEARLAADPATGTFCHGEEPTQADLCLVSLALGVRLFNLEVGAAPTVHRIVEACLAMEPIARAHPLRQRGAPVQP